MDLKMSFKDMDLSPVTPYSGKYAGYAIEKGKLSFDLKYLIAKRKLESQNVVFIDQLTLGEKSRVPGHEAPCLPGHLPPEGPPRPDQARHSRSGNPRRPEIQRPGASSSRSW